MHKARTGHKTEFMSEPERAGISIGTPATEGNWFLAKNPRKKSNSTTLKWAENLTEPEEAKKAWNSLRFRPEASAIRKTVFWVRHFKEHEDMGSKGDFFKLSRTRERSQSGTTRLTAGFSKSILLMTSERTGWEEKSTEVKCFRVEALADLYPLMEEGKSFFSSKRKIRKSAIEVTVGSMGSICRWRHQSIQVFQQELYRDCVVDRFAAQTLSADF